MPNFCDSAFLHSHIQSILAFYDKNLVSDRGGFNQAFRDDGSVYDAGVRHLVSSTRLIFNYANAYQRHGDPRHKQWAQMGLDYLRSAHQQATGHFAWELDAQADGRVVVSDGRAMAYGHAFVMLAAASAHSIELQGAAALIDEAWEFLETHFWQDEHKAYADERDASLQHLDPYRGQNANMHTCEALLAAYGATAEPKYLHRASILAERFAFDLANQGNGLIWEHYTSEWLLDSEYNIDKPDDLFKPWGYQPGHQVEWSKLLLQLNHYAPDKRWQDKAASLFNSALEKGWDWEYGGLVYGFAPDGEFCDSHKYFWVHAEAIAAAWRLYKLSGEDRYLEDYKRLWTWSWQHLVDHQLGAWFRIRNRDGSAFDDLKSPPGKVDYHTLGACWDILDVGMD